MTDTWSDYSGCWAEVYDDDHEEMQAYEANPGPRSARAVRSMKLRAWLAVGSTPNQTDVAPNRESVSGLRPPGRAPEVESLPGRREIQSAYRRAPTAVRVLLADGRPLIPRAHLAR
jgi:hypothetical protein